jgi:hypothetical protein
MTTIKKEKKIKNKITTKSMTGLAARHSSSPPSTHTALGRRAEPEWL